MSESYDDQILEALTGITKRRNGRSVSADTLAFATGIERRIVVKRLPKLEKYGMVRRKVTREVDFWGI